jgi:hypothetical protein
MDQLRTRVLALNKDIGNFASLVDDGYIVPHMRHISSYTDATYQEAYHSWFPGAWDDFVSKVAVPYRSFDVDKYYEVDDNDVDPNLYVSTKKRKVILGGIGSVWIDMDLTGLVRGRNITKWTRVCFLFDDTKWIVSFDPTFDESEVFDDPRAKTFVQMMKTNGKDVNLT